MLSGIKPLVSLRQAGAPGPNDGQQVARLLLERDQCEPDATPRASRSAQNVGEDGRVVQGGRSTFTAHPPFFEVASGRQVKPGWSHTHRQWQTTMKPGNVRIGGTASRGGFHQQDQAVSAHLFAL